MSDFVTSVPTSSLDHDDSDFWWDSYVTQFPSNFYSLISTEELDELLYDVEHAYTMDEFTYTADQLNTYTKFEDPIGYDEQEMYDADEQGMYDKQFNTLMDAKALNPDTAATNLQTLLAVSPKHVSQFVSKYIGMDWCPDKNIYSSYTCVEMTQPVYVIRTRLPSIYHASKRSYAFNHGPRRSFAFNHAPRRRYVYYHALSQRSQAPANQQPLRFTITFKEDVKEKRLTHNSNCGIVRRQRGLRGKTRVTPHHSPVHLY